MPRDPSAPLDPPDASPSRRTPTLPRALVFMTARDCEKYVGAALASVASQTHRELHVLFVDDSSSDATGEVARAHLETLFAGRHTYVRNESSWGKARNAHVHLREALPRGDFVAVVDGDDQLIEPTILAELARNYAAGSDVVWTNL